MKPIVKKLNTGVNVIQTRCKNKQGKQVIAIAIVEPKKQYKS